VPIVVRTVTPPPPLNKGSCRQSRLGNEEVQVFFSDGQTKKDSGEFTASQVRNGAGQKKITLESFGGVHGGRKRIGEEVGGEN